MNKESDIIWKKKNHSFTFSSENGLLLELAAGDIILSINHPIWSIDIKGKNEEKTRIDSLDALHFSYIKESYDLKMVWYNDSVKVIVSFMDQNGKTGMKITVEILSEDTLFAVQFPRIGNIPYLSENGREDKLLLPWQNGFVIDNPIQTLFPKSGEIPFWNGRDGRKYENEYPAQFSFQFSAYYSNKIGLYFGTEDANAYIKTIGYYLSDTNDSFHYIMTNYPENMGKTRQYVMPYCAVFDVFSGDWQIAADIYRAWAQNQSWCQKSLLQKEIPNDLYKTDLWRVNFTNYELGTRTEEYIDTCRYFKKELNARIAMHWYGWNCGRHDYEYPEYINPKLIDWPEQLTEYNQKMREEGFVRIPYVNARLWDTSIPAWKEENASVSAIRNELGQYLEEPWNPDTILCPMCPYTEQWQEKIVEFGNKYVNKLGFDGLYVDQIASFNATLCFDERHGHPIGGGTWWAESYQKIVRQLRSKIDTGCILTSESCCEVYSEIFDIFLVLDTNGQDNSEPAGGQFTESVPLFNMVYGHHMLTYGSVSLLSGTIEQFEFNTVRNLLWGILPTVEGFSMEEIKRADFASYFESVKEVVSFYQQHKHDIFYGRPCRVLSLECPLISITWTKHSGEQYRKTYQGIQAVEWEREDFTHFILGYNLTDKAIITMVKECKVVFEPHKIEMIPH